MNIYTLVSRGPIRAYKFAVYAINREQAASRMQAMYFLFVDHYSQLEQAKLDMIYSPNSIFASKSQAVVQAAKILSHRTFNFNTEAFNLITDENKEYLGRSFGNPWCLFTIFDAKTEEELCSFQLRYTEFEDYPVKVKDEIKEYKETNEKVVPIITDFIAEFFRLHPENEGVQDIIRLCRDYNRLCEEKLSDFDCNKISEESVNQYVRPKRYIDSKRKCIEQAIDKDPLFKQFNQPDKTVSSCSSIEQAAMHQLDIETRITPLMYAVYRTSLLPLTIDKFRIPAMKSLRMLLDAGAEINVTDRYGRTSLMYLVLGHYIWRQKGLIGSEQLVRFLVEYGADPSVKDHDGCSVIDYFIEEGDEAHPSVALLRRADEIQIMARAFVAGEFSKEAIDVLNSEDLMHFIFYLAYEFKSQPARLNELPTQSMNYIRAKSGQLEQSTYFTSLAEETKQHFAAVTLFNTEPELVSAKRFFTSQEALADAPEEDRALKRMKRSPE